MVGLILGKFLPPHAGHLYLVHRALQDCEKVYLLLCSQTTEPIPGIYRHRWLRLIYQNECLTGHLILRHITEEISDAHRDNPDAPRIWAQKVREHVSGKIDRVYTSEAYGTQFADALSATLVSVDPGRDQVPVSATDIREHPLHYWSYIPVFIRPYFIHRIWHQLPTQDKKLITTLVPIQSRVHAESIAHDLADLFHAPVSASLDAPRPVPLLFSFAPAAELLSMGDLQQRGLMPPPLQVDEPLMQGYQHGGSGRQRELEWYLQRLDNLYGIQPATG